MFKQLIPLEEVHTTQSSMSIPLENAVWQLIEGSGDVVRMENDHPHFLQEFSAGALLFGSANAPLSFIAEPGSLLRKFDRQSIDAWLNLHTGEQELFLSQFNHWLGAISSSLIPWRIEKEIHFFQPREDGYFSLKNGEKCLPPHHPGTKKNVVLEWVELKQGSLELLGFLESSYKPKSWIPLFSDVWYYAQEDSVLKKMPSSFLFENQNWCTALDQFYDVFLKAIRSYLSLKEPRETELLMHRSTLEAQNLDASLSSLAAVLDKQKTPDSLQKDPLLLACMVVGKELNIHFKEADLERPSDNLTERIRAICDATSVRFRKIKLNGHWFKEDNGPLVGFFGPLKKPVALLIKDKSYWMIDPSSNEQKKVDGSLKDQFLPFAYEFYASLPKDTLNLKKILRFSIFAQKKNLFYIFLISLIVSSLHLSLPFASKFIFGVAIPQQNKELLFEIAVAVFVAAFSFFLYSIAQGYFIFRTNNLAGNRLETALIDRVLRLPVKYFSRFSAGALYSRINGLVTIRRALSNYNIVLILNAIFAVVALWAMFFFSVKLSAITLVALVLCSILLYYLLNKISEKKSKSYEYKGKLSGFIVQVISGISKLRAAGGEKRAFSKWAQIYTEDRKNDLLGGYYRIAVETFFAVMPSFLLLLIFSTLIYQIFTAPKQELDPVISIGDFFGFITAFSIFSTAVFNAMPAFIFFFQTAKPIWKWVYPIFKYELEAPTQKKQENEIKGFVSFEQVVFRYEETSPPILKNVSFKAAPGEFIGIVGPTGSGKSTIIRLLLGFEKAERGNISFDGVEISHLDLLTLRRQLGVVMQDGSILGGTIYENLVCGGIYSKEQVERAVHLSAFDQDLWNFPMGLHTVLSSGGETLSGGQRQRLLIARALVSEPKILLFDEAVNALDNRTQRQVSKNIEKLNVTRIVIAHRLTTLRECDRIYVLDNGEIVASGTFEELSSTSGHFADIASRQQI